MNRMSCPCSAGRLLVLSAVVLAFVSFASASWKEKVLYSFQGGNNDGDRACRGRGV